MRSIKTGLSAFFFAHFPERVGICSHLYRNKTADIMTAHVMPTARPGGDSRGKRCRRR